MRHFGWDEGTRSSIGALGGYRLGGNNIAVSRRVELLCAGESFWPPDLIYFSGTEVFPTLNYTIQQLFAENRGDAWLPTTLQAAGRGAASTVRDPATGEVVITILRFEPRKAGGWNRERREGGAKKCGGRG
ncbi:hypothetical protein DB354_08030 [Opitutus sp. ER46]|nr:hypothetical protein DB354_08030 [Opitutus sp. ER46]